MFLGAAAPDAVAPVLIELGLVVLVLAVLARAADRVGISPIPLYLVAGLVAGDGGLAILQLGESAVSIGSEVGVVLLLLTLGLEYSGDELGASLRSGLGAGLVDVVANAGPGVLAGLALGWEIRAAILLGGVTYISSSGVISKVLRDLDRLGNRETPSILSILVLEDLAMAVYLPVVAVLLTGGTFLAGVISVAAALVSVAVVLVVALRHGPLISRAVATRSDEALLLGVLGTTLLVAGVAARLQVSAAVGAFLVGIALSGPTQERASRLVSPLRDLFAATFFLFFGLQLDPANLASVAAVAGALAVVTALTKVVTGWWAASRAGIARPGRWRAGTALVARGEFSIVIAGLGVAVGIEAELGPLSAAYVLIMAIGGPILTRFADSLPGLFTRRAGPA